MRLALFLCALAAPAAVSAPVAAQTSQRAPVPSPAQIMTPVPTVDARTLSPSDVARRNALYGEGWQYRMAPISPGANSGVPINPGVGIAPADLSSLDLRIKGDEVLMTRLRDSEHAREDGVIASIQPALPYVWRGRKWPGFFHYVNFPDLSPPINWVRNRF